MRTAAPAVVGLTGRIGSCPIALRPTLADMGRVRPPLYSEAERNVGSLRIAWLGRAWLARCGEAVEGRCGPAVEGRERAGGLVGGEAEEEAAVALRRWVDTRSLTPSRAVERRM